MYTSRFSIHATRGFVWAVVAAAAAASIDLVVRASVRSDDVGPLIVFGGLGVLASLLSQVSMTRRTARATRVTHQIGSAFAYPLLLLVDPVLTAGTLVAMTLFDALRHRRRPFRTAFNCAQLVLATWVAVRSSALLETLGGAPGGSHRGWFAVALWSVLVFAFLNHALTYAVTGLANGAVPGLRTWIARIGLLNELLCVFSGAVMAVLWIFDPWLVVLGIGPLAIVVAMVFQLARREQTLEDRERELRALQALGLELGTELDAGRLPAAVLRTARDAVHASGALLALEPDEGADLEVRAHLNIDTGAVARLDRAALPPGFFETAKPFALNAAEARTVWPSVVAPQGAAMLLVPLEVRERRGLLVLVREPSGRVFDAEDERRLRTLIPFIDVALSNAELVEELGETQGQLAQAEKMSALGLLVSGVAHELNNPLAAVLGFAELLAGREGDERRRQMLLRIQAETRRAAKIVQDLLTFSRKQRPERALLDLNSIVQDVLDFRDYDLRSHDVELVRQLDPRLPLVYADGNQIQQVLLNLLTNAVQSIEESRRDGRIVVRTSADDEAVRVAVEDNGCGIAERDRTKVFLPFFSTKELGRGTGLGLSICYGIVESHGGRIELRSQEGCGTEVTAILPRASARRDRGTRARKTAPGAGRSVLVIDRDEAARAALVRHLTSRGWEVLAATAGEELPRLVERHAFASLIVDLETAAADLDDLVALVRESHPALARATVLLAGDGEPPVLPPFPVLRKPIDVRALDRLLAAGARRGGSSAGVA